MIANRSGVIPRWTRLAVILPIAFAARPLLAQYRFTFGSVTSQATSKSEGTPGTPYTASGMCVLTSCSGSLTPTGFHDNGESKIDTEDVHGVVISLAHGTTQNNTNVTTTPGNIQVSISSMTSAYASAELANGSASTPAIYKAPNKDGTAMSMSWDINTASWLTATNLKAVTSKIIKGGTGWSTAGWIINVQLHDGTIVAQYTQDNMPPSFTIQIPGNTTLSIGWTAFSAASATAGAFGGAVSANTTAQITGEIEVAPIGS